MWRPQQIFVSWTCSHVSYIVSPSIDNRNLNIFPYKRNLFTKLFFTNKSVQRCRALSSMQRLRLSNLTRGTLNPSIPYHNAASRPSYTCMLQLCTVVLQHTRRCCAQAPIHPALLQVIQPPSHIHCESGGRGHPKPHIWNQRPRFTYSLYNF